MSVIERPERLYESPPVDDLEALIKQARRRQRRRRWGIAAALIVLASAAAIYLGVIRARGTSTSNSSRGPQRLCVVNGAGWKSRFVSNPGTAPALLLTNFRFGRVDYLFGHTDPKLDWPRGGILISIANWTGAATKAMMPQYRTTPRLGIGASDFASFEGVRILGQRHVRLNGQLLEVWVQARPTTSTTIAEANQELAKVRVCG
jgi:hypothetical protein